MKLRISSPILAALAFVAFGLTGCLEDSCDLTYKHAVYEPVYMSPQEFQDAVQVSGPQDVVEPGKIYVKDNILLINEII